MRKTFSRSPFIAALDIGSTKICCALAQPIEDSDDLQIFGLGHQLSQGIRNGKIVNIHEASRVISKAIHAAEHMARQPIQEVFVNLSGTVISLRPTITENIGGREIEEEDIQNLLIQAQKISTKIDKEEMLHCLPIYYTVDDNKSVLDPIGMYAETLGVKVHVIATSKGRIKNLVNTLDKAQMDAQHIIYTPYASGLGTLVEDEMDLGVGVIDFGGGTTSISIFKSGHCLFAASLPIGGMHITNDIAHALSTPIAQAERLKILYGSAVISPSDKKERLKIPQISIDKKDLEKSVTRFELNAVIQPRLDEIFDALLDTLRQYPEIQAVARRFALTGGGSQMTHIKKYATKRLGQQVRLGIPLGIQGLTESSGGASFSVCAGLLHYGTHAVLDGLVKHPSSSWFGRLFNWIK